MKDVGLYNYFWTDTEKICQCANSNALRQFRVHTLLPSHQFLSLMVLFYTLEHFWSCVWSECEDCKQIERINIKHFYG